MEGLFPKNMRTVKIKNEIDIIRKQEDTIKQEDLKYKAGKYNMIFNNMKRQDLLLKVFILVKLTYTMDQTNLLKNMVKFSNKSRPKQNKIRIKNKIHLIV